VESYSYDVYGQVVIADSDGNPLASSSVGNRFLYTGRELDSETGLYYYRARYYSPSLGRFLQRDPVGYLIGSNLYTYTYNSPVNLTDPLGLFVVGGVTRPTDFITPASGGIPIIYVTPATDAKPTPHVFPPRPEQTTIIVDPATEQRPINFMASKGKSGSKIGKKGRRAAAIIAFIIGLLADTPQALKENRLPYVLGPDRVIEEIVQENLPGEKGKKKRGTGKNKNGDGDGRGDGKERLEDPNGYSGKSK
jgi:RHS repeat-associated protein